MRTVVQMNSAVMPVQAYGIGTALADVAFTAPCDAPIDHMGFCDSPLGLGVIGDDHALPRSARRDLGLLLDLAAHDFRALLREFSRDAGSLTAQCLADPQGPELMQAVGRFCEAMERMAKFVEASSGFFGSHAQRGMGTPLAEMKQLALRALANAPDGLRSAAIYESVEFQSGLKPCDHLPLTSRPSSTRGKHYLSVVLAQLKDSGLVRRSENGVWSLSDPQKNSSGS